MPFPPLAFAVAVAVELGGGLLLISGYQSRVVAAALAVFAVATAVLFQGSFADQNQMIHFLKNVGDSIELEVEKIGVLKNRVERQVISSNSDY